MEDFVQNFDLVVQNLSDNDLLVVFESLKLIKQSLSKPVYKGLICECKLRSEALFSALNLIFQKFSLKVGPFAGAVVSEDFVRVIRIAIEVYSIAKFYILYTHQFRQGQAYCQKRSSSC